MLSILSDFPDHVAGFKAKGYVNALDYESVVIPTIEEILQHHDKACLLIQLPDDYSGYEMSGWLDYLKLAFTHYDHWGRVAVVTDSSWFKYMLKVASMLMNAEVKLFNNYQFESAKQWVSDWQPK